MFRHRDEQATLHSPSHLALFFAASFASSPQAASTTMSVKPSRTSGARHKSRPLGRTEEIGKLHPHRTRMRPRRPRGS